MPRDTYGKVVTPDSSLERACQRCGHVIQAFASFCPQCGARISHQEGKRWFHQAWLKTIAFILFTPLWAVLVLTDRESRIFFKVIAIVFAIAYLSLISYFIGNILAEEHQYRRQVGVPVGTEFTLKHDMNIRVGAPSSIATVHERQGTMLRIVENRLLDGHVGVRVVNRDNPSLWESQTLWLPLNEVDIQ